MSRKPTEQLYFEKFNKMARVKYGVQKFLVSTSVADPDPGSGAFLPLGSMIRIQDDFFPDPGSRFLDPGSQI
jgi:hypothetical protein